METILIISLRKYFILCSLDMALSSMPDTLFTSRSTNFGGTVIPQELSQQQQVLSARQTGKAKSNVRMKIQGSKLVKL